ncbi:NAD(P)/FAD-dependent oxidoreductase [Amaricoccus solimangrovi]|uniref:Thioredoxin reductase n=1 Tax=Amaricoccus solimangrovi TaxID=2589815 RepID=A0A501WP16_9RHOB|nr:FAD-dependent oxidoreductase [Amaricoccus solimangrovi]TPE47476.1 FAD-binding protein [Amaricoccus solimangrovi]
MRNFDVVVIGQGYAGLMAARLAAERGLSTANVEAMFAGGLVMSINELEPSPDAGAEGGGDLTSTIAMENMDRGIETISSPVAAVERNGTGWKVRTDEGELGAKNVIVASGARLRKLGVPGEEEFFGRGVSECADCDGPMYGGATCVVVGGGDSAFQEALALTHYAESVKILLRGAAPRARTDLVERVAREPKISVITGTEVREVVGDASGVTGVRVANGLGEETLPCAGVFVFVGLDPVSGFLPGEVERDASGAVLADAAGRATLPGLFAIGAVRAGFGGLLTDAADDAARAVAGIA